MGVGSYPRLSGVSVHGCETKVSLVFNFITSVPILQEYRRGGFRVGVWGSRENPSILSHIGRTD